MGLNINLFPNMERTCSRSCLQKQFRGTAETYISAALIDRMHPTNQSVASAIENGNRAQEYIAAADRIFDSGMCNGEGGCGATTEV